jgi:hypothetical protein
VAEATERPEGLSHRLSVSRPAGRGNAPNHGPGWRAGRPPVSLGIGSEGRRRDG